MDTINILTYIEKRQLGYAGPKNKLSGMFIEKMGYTHEQNDNTHNINIQIGNTFACKFSRNKNNLHIVGCSTEHGEIIVQNTVSHYNDDHNKQFKRNVVHDNAIFNFAWAEPQMKLITACGDQSSKLFSLSPTGKLEDEREFMYNSSVKTVMFQPGSSDVFCGGCQDGSLKIWDARINNNRTVLEFEHNIPNTHGVYSSILKNKKVRKFGISSVIFKTDQTVISSSSMDHDIKLWDLRKSYRQVKGNTEPLPLLKYNIETNISPRNSGYGDLITNPQSTFMYASCINNIIYCYSLDSIVTKPICQYSGHKHETGYSKISISNDGHYLFSGCMENRGFIWLTDYPYQEGPMFKINGLNYTKSELSTSDWCADSTCIKLVTSSDSMPMVWSVLPEKERSSVESTISRTSLYKSKSFSTKMCTVPIKFGSELNEKYKKETEKIMENWYVQNKNYIPNEELLNLTPKQPWEVLFSTKKTSPSSIPVSTQLETSPTYSRHRVSNKIPEVVTPTSTKKRKKSTLSPKSLIDQYLVPKRKRENLDTVHEI